MLSVKEGFHNHTFEIKKSSVGGLSNNWRKYKNIDFHNGPEEYRAIFSFTCISYIKQLYYFFPDKYPTMIGLLNTSFHIINTTLQPFRNYLLRLSNV